MSTFLSHELLLENWTAPAVSVPGSHADPDQAPDRREGEAVVTVGAGTHRIRLDGELRSGGSTYVITVRDRTLNLDGKPWELAKL